VFDIGTIADLTETTPDFALTSFFDVFTEIAVDGGLDGSASLGTVTTEFGFVPTQVIPEPTSFLLLGSGLVAVLRRRKER
jgi:PEP-CTERM motif-containing protein